MNTGAGTMQTPTPNQGEQGKEINTGNRRRRHRHKRTELFQLHTSHEGFKGNTTEVGNVICLISEKLDIGTAFDKFREKLKGYAERKFDNTKYVMCVVTYMEDLMNNILRQHHYEIFRQRGSKVHPEEEKTVVSTDKIHGHRRKN